MVLTKGQTQKSMEDNEEPEIDPHRFTSIFPNESAKLIEEMINSSSMNSAGANVDL